MLYAYETVTVCQSSHRNSDPLSCANTTSKFVYFHVEGVEEKVERPDDEDPKVATCNDRAIRKTSNNKNRKKKTTKKKKLH